MIPLSKVREKAMALCYAIEQAGASEQHTELTVKASELLAKLDVMIAAETAAGIPPAPWFNWRGRKYSARRTNDAKIKLIIACPICGDGVVNSGWPEDEMSLSHQVTVAPNGAMTVSPSVVCPRKSCTFHVTITNGEATP